MKVSDRRKKEKLKLDQMMRVLFRLSKRLMVQLINGLFEEQFATEDVKSIHYGNAEFIMDSYERIVGDLFLTLQVFGSRKNMRLIAASTRPDDEKRRLFAREFARLKTKIEETLAVIRDLHRQRLLPTGDMDRILQVLGSILNYLYRHYGEYKQTEEEVSRMIKTFIPEALKKGREEGKKEGVKEGVKKGQLKVARNLLKLGVDMDTIVEATELTPEEVMSLEAKK